MVMIFDINDLVLHVSVHKTLFHDNVHSNIIDR